MITNIIQNNFSNITRDELSLSFWSNPNKIERFCNGILNYFGHKDKLISVNYIQTGITASVYKSKTENSVVDAYDIYLPEISLFGYSDLDKAKFSLLSSIFLKHELAHIIFSDFDTKNTIADIVEDARVEYHYSNRLKGNKRNFLILNYFFYKMQKEDIENQEFSLKNLAHFFRYSLSGIRYWKNTESIQKYDALYKQYVDKVLTDEYKEVYTQLFESSLTEEELLPNFKITARIFTDDNEPGQLSGYTNIREGLEYQPHQNKSLSVYAEIESIENEDLIKEELFGEDDNDDLQFFQELVDKTEFGEELKNKYDINSFYSKFYKQLKSQNSTYDFNISPYDIKDILHLNMINFFSYFMGFGFNQKKGNAFYKLIVNQNKKVINESVRFLNLKLQNKERIKYKRFLREGDLDTDNIHNIIIEKEDPKVFQRKIQQINPKSSIHILIDISGSMQYSQVEMCLINTIILYEICKKVGIKFSFQMFTTVPNNFFTARKRKNPILLRNVIHLFKNQENNVYVNFHDERESKLLSHIKNKEDMKMPLKGISFSGQSKGILFYLKNINEEPSFIFERALGILFNSIKKIRSLSGGTPEFECLAQTIKLHNNDKNKNKMLFLINDGNYDNSFARQLGNAEDRHFFRIPCALFETSNNIVENINEKINNATNFLTFLNKTENLKYKDFYFDITQKILENLIKTRNDPKSVNRIAYRHDNSYYFYHKEAIDRDYIPFVTKSFENSVLIYKSFIDTLRKSGWKIFGGGIKSTYGIRYIGEENFAYFNDAEDIKQNFSKKLRNYF